MKKLTKAQQKIIDKLIKSQEVVKRYLMFNGSDTQVHWIPPLDYAEKHTNSAAQARVLRLAKCLFSNEIFYITNKTGKEPDLYKRRLTEFDKYIISHTSIGLNRSEDGKYTQNENLPLVVPMIYSQKKYEMSDIKFDRPSPIIIVAKSDKTTDRIIVNEKVKYRMTSVLQYIGSFEVPFTDECIEYILYDGRDKFLSYMNTNIKENPNFGTIEGVSDDLNKVLSDMSVSVGAPFVILKNALESNYPYYNSYFKDPPIRESKKKE